MIQSNGITSQVPDRLAHAKNHCASKRPLQKPAFVYVIECQGFVKIGVATNPKARLADLQVGCPFTLNLLKAEPHCDPYDFERLLHKKLKSHRGVGEWFKLPPEVLANLLAMPG